MTVDLVLDALENAVMAQQPAPGLILHTDLGTQYTSEDFRKKLEHYGITPSYSRKGCPYDNACIESFHATLKKKKSTVHATPILKPLELHCSTTSKVGTTENEFMAVLAIYHQMFLKKSVVLQRKRG